MAIFVRTAFTPPIHGMDNPAEHLSLLAAVPSAAEAALIVGALNEAGLESVATGKMTTNSQIASGEWVDVLVTEADLPVARNTLERFKETCSEIDWSQVDVGEPE